METSQPIMKKQIAYVGFYPRLLAAMIDVTIVMILFYPILAGIAWLTFGTDNPVKDIGPLVEPGITGARNFSDVTSHLQNNEAFKQYAAENHLMLKLAVQYMLQLVLLLSFILGFWLYKSATPGKMLLSMRIVDAKTFETPSRKQLILRLFSYVISFLFFLLGFLWIAADKRKQGWHDKIAGTVVIKA